MMDVIATPAFGRFVMTERGRLLVLMEREIPL